jgi:tyrosyl-tRNA synthetase
LSFLPPEEQLERVTRGMAELYTRDDLLAKFASSRQSGRPLVIKLGLDPTAPDVHLGHVVVLRKARAFQDLGHRVVIIIGDFTARIGDPSGKSKTRPVLTAAEVDANARTYLEQVGSVLDTAPERLELRHNREWLERLSFEEILRLAGTTTVARMMERDTFEERWKAEEPIGFHEFFYPLMQGYDSVAIESDLELGGTDQTYNNLFGRDLQRSLGREPQCVMTMPILRGLDGVKKMSKSLGNTIGVTENANQMVQKIYSMDDALVLHYYELLTEEPLDPVSEQLEGGGVQAAKRRLGELVASAFHPADEVAQALANLDSDVPVEMEEIEVAAAELGEDGTIWIVKLLAICGFKGSNRDLRARVEQGACRIDGEVIADSKANVAVKTGMTVSFGNVRKKTNWRRIRLGG